MYLFMWIVSAIFLGLPAILVATLGFKWPLKRAVKLLDYFDKKASERLA